MKVKLCGENTIKIGKDVFNAQPADAVGGCKGCAFLDTKYTCQCILAPCLGYMRTDRKHIIYIKEESK